MPPYDSSHLGDFAKPESAKTTLANDARNRALRTFLQGLAIDLAVAVAAFVLANVDSITDRQGLILAATALGKTVATTVASYVMRRFLDPSRIPTPLPPSDPGEPDDEAGYGALETVVMVLFALILLFVFLSVAGLR